MKNAPYNPRVISKKARKQLKENIERVGLVEPVVWNKNTGNVVSGHQRLSVLDSLEEDSNYLVPVAIVEFDPKTEAEQNIFLNNTSTQGEFDLEKLGEMFQGPDKINHDNAGLDLSDMYALLGETVFHDDPEAMIELSDRVRKLKEEQSKIMDKNAKRDATCFFLSVVFKDEEHLAAFLKLTGLPNNIGDPFVDGREMERLLKEGIGNIEQA